MPSGGEAHNADPASFATFYRQNSQEIKGNPTSIKMLRRHAPLRIDIPRVGVLARQLDGRQRVRQRDVLAAEGQSVLQQHRDRAVVRQPARLAVGGRIITRPPPSARAQIYIRS